MGGICDVYLISTAAVLDELRQTTTQETRRKVYGTVTSVTGSEFTNAGILGIRADLRVLVYAPDYQNETAAEIENVRYSVYRTYKNPNNRMELYLTRRAGDENAVAD